MALPTACSPGSRAHAIAEVRRAVSGLVVLLVAALAATTTVAEAQQPFLVDDAAVTSPRVWHLEVSNQADALRTPARPLLWQTALDVELIYGVADRLEVAALLPLISLFTSDDAIAGIGDSSVGLKYRLTADAEAPHQFAISAALELPTGRASRQLGSGLVDYGLTMITQHQVSTAGTVRTNVGAVLVGNTLTGVVGVSTRGGVFVGGISYVHRLSSRVQAGGEFVSYVSARRLGGSVLTWQTGCNIAIGPSATLDVSLLGGWLSASPRVGAQVGISMDLNRRAGTQPP